MDVIVGENSLSTVYSEYSKTSGALFNFVFITENQDVDFTRSFLLLLDRNTSLNFTLPTALHPGHYRMYAYDIGNDGTLLNGISYPAVEKNLTASEGVHTMSYLYYYHALGLLSRSSSRIHQ